MKHIQQVNEFFGRFGKQIEVNERVEIEAFKNRIKTFLSSDIELHDVTGRIRFDYNKIIMKYGLDSSTKFNTFNHIDWFLNLESNDPEAFHYYLYKLEYLLNEASRVDWYQYGIVGGGQLQDCWVDNTPTLINQVKNELEHTIFADSYINIAPVFIKISDYVYQIKFKPAGDVLLDKVLVNEVIPSLHNNSKKLYLTAIEFYQKRKYKDCADSLRKCLEAWLRDTLGVDKTIENMVKEKGCLSKALKDKCRKTTYQELYCQKFVELMGEYMNIHNGIVKHPKPEDIKFIEAEAEFVLYQTGAVIRFINKVLNS